MNAEHSAAHDYLAENAPDRPELAAAVVVLDFMTRNPTGGLERLLRDAADVLGDAGLGGLRSAVAGLLEEWVGPRRPIVDPWVGPDDGPARAPWGDHANHAAEVERIGRTMARPPAARPQPPFAPAPADLGPRIEAAERREREAIDAFLADVGATTSTHCVTVYPSPADRPPGQERHRDYVYVAAPWDEWEAFRSGASNTPTRDEACRLWPHRRIWRESVVGDRPR